MSHVFPLTHQGASLLRVWYGIVVTNCEGTLKTLLLLFLSVNLDLQSLFKITGD